MVNRKKEDRDHLKLYCRTLGHWVPFEYCRSMNEGLLCRSILDCWKDTFAVDGWIQEFYTKEEIQFILRPARPKIVQIYDSLRKASENNKNE